MGLSSSHSLEHPFGAIRLAFCSGAQKLEYSTLNLLNVLLNLNIGLMSVLEFYTICCMILLLLICAGDIELNPGPRKNNTSYNFSFCHCNLNSIAAHNFSKLSLLGAYNVQHQFKLIRAGNPSDSKKMVWASIIKNS